MRAFLSLAFLLAWAPVRAEGGRLVVGFDPSTTPDERRAILARQGLRVLEDLDPLPAAVVHAPGRISLHAVRLKADPRVREVEEDFFAKWIEEAPASMAEVPLPSMEAVLGLVRPSGDVRPEQIPWGIAKVGAPQVWARARGTGVKVAVVDTGVGPHPDLKVEGGYNASLFGSGYDDDNGHGTHVAGTIGARRNDKGVVGVAPKARLYGIKVLDKDGSGWVSDIVKGLIWCANNGIQVGNMSLGSPMPSDTLQRALRYGKARGMVLVAAAGNSGGSVGYPAAYPETIAVAASDWKDQLASFSSRGPQVRLIAPGVAVVSTVPGREYASFSGTSMAAPHVAGLAAMAVSLGYRGLDGPDGVLEQLLRSSKCLVKLEGEETPCMGMVDAGMMTRGESPLAALAR